jgi:type VI secretion system secreted protein VgrG
MADLFAIESDALPITTRVMAFTGDEAISTLYRFDVYVIIHDDATRTLDLDALLAQRATLRTLYEDGTPRMTFHGVIVAAELMHDVSGEGVYHLTIMPRAWHLTLNKHSRVFADKSVYKSIREIIKKVMTFNGFTEGDDYEFRLTRRYKPYEHITQYKESDFDFVSRWMEREGIYYFFEHDGAHEKMVLIDDHSQHTALASEAKRFLPNEEHSTSGVEAFSAFTARASTLPARVVLRDYNYLQPTTEVTATEPIDTHVDEVVVRYGENYDTAHVRDLSLVRAQEHKSHGHQFRGSGRVFDLRSGNRFELTEHSRPELNRQYLVISLHHEASNLSLGHEAAMDTLGMRFETPYRIDATAIHHDEQFRAPSVTTVPRVWGFESATVDGAATSPYAQMDSHGRYKVRVKFDELNHIDDKNSLFIRMLQPHGGSPEGFHFPLRKGTEVMLSFVGGDPDLPVIVSVAPNADRPSVVNADNHTLNVIHTGSDNRLEIDDAQGAQYIVWTTPFQNTAFHLGAKTHRQFNVYLTTAGDCGFNFGTDWDIKVGGWKHEDVVGVVTETFHDTQTTTVTGLVTETYKAGQTTTIQSVGQTTEVTGLVKETYHTGQNTTITSGQTTDVTGLCKETYNTGHETTVTSGKKLTVTGGQKITVTGAAEQTYNTGLTETVHANKTETIDATYTLTVNGNKVESVTGEESYIKGAERHLILGFQSEIFCGIKHETHLVSNFDIHLAIEVAAHMGPKIELRAGIDVTAHSGFSLTLKEAIEVNLEGVSISNYAACIRATSAYTGLSAIHLFI